MRKCFLLNSFLFFIAVQIVTAQTGVKTNILWIDPLENINQITDRTRISQIMTQASNSGLQAVALGIKTNSGQVIYESEIAPRLLEWNGQNVPLGFDIIREFSEQAVQNGLLFYVIYPVFAGGNMIERKGLLYTEHPEWQSYVYVVENEEPEIIPITQWAHGRIAYENPLNMAAQNYEISVINEFLEEYQVSGFIFDKLRFYGIEADFSEESRKAFEDFLGGSVSWWPQDIYEWQLQNEKWEIVPGQRFRDWIKFRAMRTKEIANKLVQAIKRKDPGMQVGNFVGGWYPTYYEYGVNWASQNYVPEAEWVPSNYNSTSMAEEFDYLITASFFSRVNMQDAETAGAEWWMSVEGASELANEAIAEAVPNYGAILVEQFKNDREKFKLALTTTLEKTDGLLLTDLSHILKHNYWGAIAAALTGKTDRTLQQ